MIKLAPVITTVATVVSLALQLSAQTSAPVAAPKPASAAPPPPEKVAMESVLETISLKSRQRTTVYTTTENIEGAFWSADAEQIFFSERGLLTSVPAKGGQPRLHDAGLNHLGGSLGYSPDKKQFVLTHYSGEHGSRVYLVPVEGGQPRLVTTNAPSWWHSCSPDGKTMLFVGLRHDNLDIYSIPVQGGNETRLTTYPGIDDGPEFSTDGRHIFFNSDRSGRNQIWRMNADGTGPEQILHDRYHDWYPHVSPDGKWITFLSYEEPEVKGHPQHRPVLLRLLPTAGGQPEVLARLTGGQGTYDANAWSPDSSRIAFISFRPLRR